MATLMLTALAVRVRLYSLSGERGHHGRSQASCAAGDLRATHPSHIPQPHTLATYPSHTPQPHTPATYPSYICICICICSCPSWPHPSAAPPTACFDPTWACYSIVGDLRAQRPRRDLVPADRRRHVRLPQLPYDTYYISYTDYAWYTECT